MSPDDTSAAPAAPSARSSLGASSAEAAPAPAAPPSFAADHVAEVAADASNIDALIEQARAAVEAEAAQQETAGVDRDAAATTEPPPSSSPPSAADDADHGAAIEALKARGYEVTPPAPPPPPPDPHAELAARLAPLVGTADEYRAARDAALAPLPPLPGDTDPDWQAKFDAHQQAVAYRDQAASTLARYDHARETAGVGRDYFRERVLGELGQALQGIPATYGLSPEQAARVTQPRTMTDVVAAVVEARDALWAQRLDENTKHWQGEVKRAGTDRAGARLDALGRGPQPGAPPAGRPGDAAIAPIFDGTARPEDLTEDVIAAMKRGDFRSYLESQGR